MALIFYMKRVRRSLRASEGAPNNTAIVDDGLGVFEQILALVVNESHSSAVEGPLFHGGL